MELALVTFGYARKPVIVMLSCSRASPFPRRNLTISLGPYHHHLS
jgi:hypothetical protein